METPTLTRSTQEGARDFLVPSRIMPGAFYALPQSPQLYKQMLMVGGVETILPDRPLLRDEDSRADRQPEFTQLDMEMSFVEQEDIFAPDRGLYSHVWKDVFGKELKTPFPRIHAGGRHVQVRDRRSGHPFRTGAGGRHRHRGEVRQLRDIPEDPERRASSSAINLKSSLVKEKIAGRERRPQARWTGSSIGPSHRAWAVSPGCA